MRQLPRNLAIAAALALTALACSDDIDSAGPFDLTEPDAATDVASDADTAPDASPDTPEDTDASPDTTEDADAAKDTDPTLPPAPHNICELSDPTPDTTPCPIQDPDAYGDCDAVLGVVFDGTQCVTASGCDCQGDDCPAFDTLEDCATSCAGAGYCQTERLTSLLTGACPGEDCFNLTTICAAPSGELADFEAFLTNNLPDLRIVCSENEGLCGANIFPHTCLPDDWCCTISGPYPFDRPRHHGHCAITLLPNTRALGCLHLE